jgi:hypothetical protein
MELSPSSEAASCAATQEFPNILQKSNVYYRVQKNPSLVPILSQINPFRITPSYLSKIHFNVVTYGSFLGNELANTYVTTERLILGNQLVTEH